MKVEPIDERLLHAISHVANYTKHNLENPDEEYQHTEGLEDALALVQEYTSCFAWNGEVSQRGEVPQCWNEDTIFEPHYEVGEISYAEEEASPEQKDANAKKLLEELT